MFCLKSVHVPKKQAFVLGLFSFRTVMFMGCSRDVLPWIWVRNVGVLL